jgi:hypothetical protein
LNREERERVLWSSLGELGAEELGAEEESWLARDPELGEELSPILQNNLKP